MRRQRPSLIALYVVAIILSVGGTKACREWRIDRCEKSGGQAVVPPYFSNHATEVSCIRANR
jgi:hypothetical protein